MARTQPFLVMETHRAHSSALSADMVRHTPSNQVVKGSFEPLINNQVIYETAINRMEHNLRAVLTYGQNDHARTTMCRILRKSTPGAGL